MKQWKSQWKRLSKGLVVMSLLFVLGAMGTAWGEAAYTYNSGYGSYGVLDLPVVNVRGDGGMFDASLMATDSTGQEFVLQSLSQIIPGPGVVATYDMTTGILHIPNLAIYGVSNTTKYAEVEMQLVPNSNPMRFRVISVIGVQLGSDDRGPQGPRGYKGGHK